MTCEITDKKISALITGYGWVTAAGSGRGWTDDPPIWQPGEPQPPISVLQSLKGGSRFGRLDHFSQIGVAAVALALEDAGLIQKDDTSKIRKERDLGLLCATTSSCEQTDHNFFETVQDDPKLASPGLFVYTLATSFLGEAALRFAIDGITLALIEPRPGGSETLRMGLEQLAYGDEEAMVIGICNLFEKKNRAAPFFPGALFLVIEKEQDKQSFFHATISCTPKENRFYCNNQRCSDILSLIERLKS